MVIRDPAAAVTVARPEISSLATRRFEMLAEEEPYDPAAMGYFIVVERGDTATALSQQLGFDVLTNRYSGIRYDQPDFTPSFEVVEEHRTCYEIVFVLSDDGFGVELFVPKEEGIDPDLLAMCSLHSVLSQESEQ